MLDKKESNSKILCEASSGNTMLSLSIIARNVGFEKFYSVVTDELPQEKINMLRFIGVEVILNKEPLELKKHDSDSRVSRVRKLARQNNWYIADQYSNYDNPEAHYKWTGPQIYSQLDGKIDFFVTSIGTNGTMIGTSKYLKEQCEKIKTIGVAVAPGESIPGPGTVEAITKLIDLDWRSHIDYIEEAGLKESMIQSLHLCRQGLLCGPSTGMSLVGINKFFQKNSNLINSDETNIVMICGDTPWLYINEYFNVLGDDYFPKVKQFKEEQI